MIIKSTKKWMIIDNWKKIEDKQTKINRAKIRKIEYYSWIKKKNKMNIKIYIIDNLWN